MDMDMNHKSEVDRDSSLVHVQEAKATIKAKLVSLMDRNEDEDPIPNSIEKQNGPLSESKLIVTSSNGASNSDSESSLIESQFPTTTITPHYTKQTQSLNTLMSELTICDSSQSQGSKSRLSPREPNKIDFRNRENMIDVTKDFLDATKCLELGELLHDPYFGLFEAMSAIEMMDPKMDAGMMCNKGKRVIMNFEQSVQNNMLKLNDLTHEELIGIMDTTFSCLVTWLEGHSLAQTVFTNLYLHNPSAVTDKYLRTFSFGILKLVDVMEGIVSKASVFEEEDFQASLYGYNLATYLPEAKVTSSLRECEDELQKKMKGLISSQGKSKDSRDNSNNNQLQTLTALQARLKFIRVLHLLLMHLLKKDSLGDCPKLFTICSESLVTIQKSASLGISRSNDETEQFMIGFELLVNQRLLPPTFPRSTRIKTLDETFSFFENVLQRVKNVLKISSIQVFHSVIDFFFSFSESQPCILSRSLLQLLYSPMRFKKPGMEDMVISMKESVISFISPPVLTNKILMQNKEVSECVDMFFDRSAPTFAALLMICGHNRARQRDKLGHILEDFANLQIETDRVDAYFHALSNMKGVRPHANCFGNWVLYHVTKTMIRYLLTGFELELYSVHEYTYIYWYLAEFLYGWLLSALSRAESYVTEGEAYGNDKNSKKGAKGKNKLTSKRAQDYTKEVCLTQAEQHMAGGYYKIMIGLTAENKVIFPHIEFDNEAVRYRHRFFAFRSIGTPAPVHYNQYKTIYNTYSKQPVDILFASSAKSFQQAKTYLEAIPNPDQTVSNLLKIAKTNLVVAKLLASGHTRQSSQLPEFDFSTHLHFPIIKVK